MQVLHVVEVSSHLLHRICPDMHACHSGSISGTAFRDTADERDCAQTGQV